MLIHIGVHNLLGGNHLPQGGRGLQGALGLATSPLSHGLTQRPNMHPGPSGPLLFPHPICSCTWGTPSQSSACCMASRAFCTGWLGSQASQSGQRPREMAEDDD